MIARFPLSSTPREEVSTPPCLARRKGVSWKGAQHYDRLFQSVNTFLRRFSGWRGPGTLPSRARPMRGAHSACSPRVCIAPADARSA